MPNKSGKFNALIWSIQMGLVLAHVGYREAIEAVGFLVDASMSNNPAIIASVETCELTQSEMALEYVECVSNGEDYKQIYWCKSANV